LGSVVPFSKGRALLFLWLHANTNYYIFAGRANFAFSSENALRPDKASLRARPRIGIGFENPSEDNFVLTSCQIFSDDLRLFFAQ
jgi:hypothetical protein